MALAPELFDGAVARATRRLAVERGAFIERGHADFRPARPAQPKLVATLIRQILDKDPERPLAAATVLMPLGSGDAETVVDLIAEVPRMTLGAPLFSTALDQIAGLSGRTLLAVLGDADVPDDDAYASLARALVTHDRKSERRLAEDLAAIGAPTSRDYLVVEERPGKAALLDLLKPTLKAAAKRLAAVPPKTAGEGGPAPLATPPGWGIGGVILTDDLGTKGAVPLSVASLDWCLPGSGLGLDTARTLRSAVDAWLGGLGIDPAALERIVIAVPWLAVSGFVGAALTGRSIVFHPDQLYGWQPLVTLVDFLVAPKTPALFIYSGHHPMVHLVAAWT